MGHDPICGIGDDYQLSQELIMELHCKNFHVLKQIHLGLEINRWDNSSVLGLDGHYVEEWDVFISKLCQCNITFSDKPYKLVWSVNTREGLVMASLSYRSIISKRNYSGYEW